MIPEDHWGQAQRITGDDPGGSLGTSPKDNWGQAQRITGDKPKGSYVNWSMALTGDYPNLVT